MLVQSDTRLIMYYAANGYSDTINMGIFLRDKFLKPLDLHRDIIFFYDGSPFYLNYSNFINFSTETDILNKILLFRPREIKYRHDLDYTVKLTLVK